MALTVNFNGKSITQPGVYTQVRGTSSVTNPVDVSGNVVILDTGSCAGFGGAGIGGTLSNGVTSIVEFSDSGSLREYLGGGPWWVLADALFRPDGPTSVGAASVFVAHCRTTTPASIVATFTNGSLTIQARREGLRGNGTVVSSNLQKGFAITLAAGTINTSAYVLRLWEGTYRGTHSDNTDLDGIPAASTTPRLIVQSSEVTTLAALIAWCNANEIFQQYFRLSASTITSTGAIVAGDLTTFAVAQPFLGGTETYNAQDVDAVLDVLNDISFGIVVSDQHDTSSASVANLKLLAWLATQARFPQIAIVGGANGRSNFVLDSLTAAATINSDRMVVVHGGIVRPFGAIAIPRTWSSLHKAAFVAGRLAGLPVQIPLTFKGLAIGSEVHNLTSKEIDRCLQAGVLYTRRDPDLSTSLLPRYVIGQGITTLQNNTALFTTDGKTFSIQGVRILSQLLREMSIAAKIDLFSTEDGPNRNNPSPSDVVEWSKKFLQNNTVTPGTDNLLLDFGNLTISVSGDSYLLSFECTLNSEVNKLLITSFVLNR